MSDYVTNQSSQFEGKVIIITGSTQGSGAETAKLFAARGANCLLYTSPSPRDRG